MFITEKAHLLNLDWILLINQINGSVHIVVRCSQKKQVNHLLIFGTSDVLHGRYPKVLRCSFYFATIK